MLVLALACVVADTPEPSMPPDPSTPTEPEPDPPVLDPSTGFERTADGAVNRVADVPSSLDDYAYGTGDCFGSLSRTEPECTPSGCDAFPNGRCASESCLSSWCTCVYACTSDADCADDQACLRPEHGLDAGLAMPECVPADCRTNADCPSGECGVAAVPDSVTRQRQMRLACRTTDDVCRSDDDCESSEDVCSPGPTGWECFCSNCWCD